MLTRRTLLGALAAGTLTRETAFAKASQPSTPVNFDVPPDACDCHTHLIGDPRMFPFWSGRVYTPEPALPAEMSALHRALHIDRVVIVTPSFYGTDNSATLYGMKARGPQSRGVAVIDANTPESSLDQMDRAGIRGIRLNLATAGQSDPAVIGPRFQAAVERARRRNWHIQIYTTLDIISAIAAQVLASPVPVVFDHFGSANAALGIRQPGFDKLVSLVGSGHAWVKISGAYRSSTQAPDYPDVAPLAKELIAANPDRILWGSDWPHTNSAPLPGHKATEVSPLYQLDDARILNQLPLWAPDAAIRKKILADNPARLYRF